MSDARETTLGSHGKRRREPRRQQNRAVDALVEAVREMLEWYETYLRDDLIQGEDERVAAPVRVALAAFDDEATP